MHFIKETAISLEEKGKEQPQKQRKLLVEHSENSFDAHYLILFGNQMEWH
jgi:hypothetical protein